MKTLFLSSYCLMMLIGSTAVQALPTTVNSDGKLVVETTQGRVEINNGNITIQGFSNLPTAQPRITNQSNIGQTQTSISSVNRTFSSSANTVEIEQSTKSNSHVLKLESASAVTGKITLDGLVVREITTRNSSIDLTSLLSTGEHELVIEAESPSNDTIKMMFNSPNSSVQHSSNTSLRHTLNLKVR